MSVEQIPQQSDAVADVQEALTSGELIGHLRRALHGKRGFKPAYSKEAKKALAKVAAHVANDIDTDAPVVHLRRELRDLASRHHLNVVDGGLAAKDAASRADDRALARLKQQFRDQFAKAAGDKEEFHRLMREAFDDEYNAMMAEDMRLEALKGDFSWMPEVELVDGAALRDKSALNQGQGLGAYSKKHNKIYLSRDLLRSDPSKASEILTEEFGHAIDARINTRDARGDEGEIFSRLVRGEKIGQEELAALKAENDSGVIEVNGEQIEVEYGLFKSIKKGIKKIGKSIKKGVKKIGKAIKKGVKKVGSAIKKGFKKIMESKLLGKIMAVARFIPIPIVQMVARGYQLLQGAYGVYQGIKNKAWGAVLSGVAGVAGGVAKFGGALGASGKFINTANNIAKAANVANGVHQAVKNKDWMALASTAVSFAPDSKFSTTFKPLLQKVQVGTLAYNAAKKGDYLGAIGVGTGLLQDITGPQGDKFLQSVGHNALTMRAIQQSIRTGDYTGAVATLTGEYADNLNLSAKDADKINNIAQTLSQVQQARDLIKNRDYAAASQLLLNTASNHTSSPYTRERLEAASRTIGQIDTTVKAFESGDYSQAINTAALAMGNPLDDKTQAMLSNIQRTAYATQSLIKSKNYAAASRLLLDTAAQYTGDPQTRAKLYQTSQAIGQVDQTVKAVKRGDYASAIQSASRALGAPLDKGTQAFVSDLQKTAYQIKAVKDAVENGDVQAAARGLGFLSESLTGNSQVSDVLFKTADTAKQVKQLKQAIDNKDWTQARMLATGLARSTTGDSGLTRGLQQLNGLLVSKQLQTDPWRTPGINPFPFAPMGAFGPMPMMMSPLGPTSPMMRTAAVDKADPKASIASEGWTDEQQELVLDLTQMSLDIVGMADPTPISDGANGLISLGRGDWFGAAISAVSMIPYIGDAAKLGKVGKWADTVMSVAAMAAKDAKFAKRVKPLLEKIDDAIGAIPDSMMNKLPEGVQNKLSAIRGKIDEVVGATRDLMVRRFNSLDEFNAAANAPAATRANQVLEYGTYKWTTDAQGRVTRAEGVVDLTAHGRKTHGVTTTDIGREGVQGDVGFHLIGDQFNGPINRVNVVPGNGKPLDLPDGTRVPNLNQGPYSRFESKVRELASIPGNKVEINVEAVYLPGNNTNRPDAFITRYRENGGQWVKQSFDNQAGG